VVSEPENRIWPWLLAAGLLVAAALRAAGLGTELWMDELLSLRSVQALSSPLQVFTEVHSDNNHYLNSLWMWTVGSGAPGWLLRLPPLLFGVALVGLAYRIERSGGRLPAIVAAALVCVSYPLIHYSSEARGYGYVLPCALLAYGLFRSWASGADPRTGVLYAVVSALAFLAQLGFATVFAAFLLWSCLLVLGSGEKMRALRAHLAVQALPAVTLGVLWAIDLRHMTPAGGFARLSPVQSLAGALGLVVGVAPGVPAAVVAIAACVAILLGARASYRDSREETLFLALAIVLSLATGALPGYGYPRYYLTAFLFSLLLLGRAAAAGLATPRWRVPAAILLLLLGAFNLLQTARFVSIGRGKYSEAVADMIAATAVRPVTVTGSHDLGTVLELGYYGPSADGVSAFAYYCHEASTLGCVRSRPSLARGETPPRFYILASLEDRFDPPALLGVPDLGEYEKVRAYPKYGLSGVYWVVYRHSKVSGATASP